MKLSARRPVPVTAKLVQKRYVPEVCCGWVMRAGRWCSSGGGSSPRSAATTPANMIVSPYPPASTTPASRSAASIWGPRLTDSSPVETACSSAAAIIASWAAGGVPGSRRGFSLVCARSVAILCAISRATVRIVPSAGSRTEE